MYRSILISPLLTILGFLNIFVSTDNSYPRFPEDFVFSAAGRKLDECVQINEPADPHFWHDNNFCWRRKQKKPGFVWSFSGMKSGMRCTRVYENSDPYSWHDNYLCVPKSSPYQFTWRVAGTWDLSRCLKWSEPWDPHHWHDNYLCEGIEARASSPVYFNMGRVVGPVIGVVFFLMMFGICRRHYARQRQQRTITMGTVVVSNNATVGNEMRRASASEIPSSAFAMNNQSGLTYNAYPPPPTGGAAYPQQQMMVAPPYTTHPLYPAPPGAQAYPAYMPPPETPPPAYSTVQRNDNNT